MAEDVDADERADFPQRFREAAIHGVLLLQRCRDCGTYNPLSVTDLCHRCGSTELATTRATGHCIVLSHTYVARPSDSGAPRTALLVELEEGVRLLGIALADGDAAFDAQLQFAYRDALSGTLYFGRLVQMPGARHGSVERSLPEAGARAAG